MERERDPSSNSKSLLQARTNKDKGADKGDNTNTPNKQVDGTLLNISVSNGVSVLMVQHKNCSIIFHCRSRDSKIQSCQEEAA